MSSISIPRFGSCRSSDADYDPLIARIGQRFDVLVNGAPVADVVAYNCDEGWVRVMKRNAHGFKYVENGLAAEETLRGAVSVRWRAAECDVEFK